MSKSLAENSIVAPMVRYVLTVAIAIIATLIATSPGKADDGVESHIRSGSVAAPGYIALRATEGVAAKLYLVDSSRQVICVYSLNNEKLRLISVRKFDYDVGIKDASVQVVGRSHKKETRYGFSRTDAKEYLDSLNAYLEVSTPCHDDVPRP